MMNTLAVNVARALQRMNTTTMVCVMTVQKPVAICYQLSMTA